MKLFAKTLLAILVMFTGFRASAGAYDIDVYAKIWDGVGWDQYTVQSAYFEPETGTVHLNTVEVGNIGIKPWQQKFVISFTTFLDPNQPSSVSKNRGASLLWVQTKLAEMGLYTIGPSITMYKVNNVDLFDWSGIGYVLGAHYPEQSCK